jgi:hypothetical protein
LEKLWGNLGLGLDKGTLPRMYLVELGVLVRLEILSVVAGGTLSDTNA